MNSQNIPNSTAQPTLTAEEWRTIIYLRSLPTEGQAATHEMIADLAKHPDKAAIPAEDTPAPEVDSEGDDTPVVWGNLCYTRREELAFIPYALQLAGLLMNDNLMHFDPILALTTARAC